MYTPMHPVSVFSPGVTIEKEHIAKETINRWHARNGAFAADR